MGDNIKEFSTTDLNLASYLKCLNYKITDIKKSGNKITFVFKDEDKRKQDVLDFFNNVGSIEPNKLLKAMHDLKGIIWNQDNTIE